MRDSPRSIDRLTLLPIQPWYLLRPCDPMARLALMRMKSTSLPGQNSSMIFFQLDGSMPYFSIPLYRFSQSDSFHLAFSAAYTTFLGLKNCWFSDPSSLSASGRVTTLRISFAQATRASSTGAGCMLLAGSPIAGAKTSVIALRSPRRLTRGSASGVLKDVDEKERIENRPAVARGPRLRQGKGAI